MRTLCPVCGGYGVVPQNLGPGTWGISSWPMETCQNCWGQKWVGEPDVRKNGTELLKSFFDEPSEVSIVVWKG